MNDMSSTIVAKSDQWNAVDLRGSPLTITIKEVRIKAGDDQPVSVLIEGDAKAFRPCKGVRRLMVRVWGADASKYIGQAMTLFCDPSVTWAGKEEGGIRVSHMSGLDEPIVEFMRTSRAATKAYKILPLVKATTTALTIDQARTDIEFAADLDELKAVWTRKSMAPFRADLQADLDARKAALAEPETARADAEHGDQNDGAAADLIARIEAAAVIADVMAVEKSYQAGRAMFEVAEQDQIEAAIDAAKASMKGGK